MPPIVSAFTPASGLPSDGAGAERDFYILPMGVIWGQAACAAIGAGTALSLANVAAFTSAGVIWREAAPQQKTIARQAVVSVRSLLDWGKGRFDRTLSRIGEKRVDWGGLPLNRPLVMGIVNATPDSFSDGGDNYQPEIAINTATAMVEAGADIIDLGGESTRPGSQEVAVDEEIRRVLPVVQALASKGIVVSIDTRHAQVMRAATQAGAIIINDVAGLREPGALSAAADSEMAVCVMHMLRDPGTMQNDPSYECAPLDVYDFLEARIGAAEQAGIPRSRITVDPGIGFGKTFEHNAQLLNSLALLHGLGTGILLGASRKRFVATLSRDEMPKQRFPGSLSAAFAGLEAGVQIFRVHDVPETVQAFKVWSAIKSGG